MNTINVLFASSHSEGLLGGTLKEQLNSQTLFKIRMFSKLKEGPESATSWQIREERDSEELAIEARPLSSLERWTISPTPNMECLVSST